jgi:hypothetical protein
MSKSRKLAKAEGKPKAATSFRFSPQQLLEINKALAGWSSKAFALLRKLYSDAEDILNESRREGSPLANLDDNNLRSFIRGIETAELSVQWIAPPDDFGLPSVVHLIRGFRGDRLVVPE